MVFNKKDMSTDIKEQLHGGSGITQIMHIVPPNKLPANAPFFSIATLKPKCSIGVHAHMTETEVYYVLSGKGVINDNGREIPVETGDCHMCGNGSSHGIVNNGDESLVFIVVIISD